MLTVHLPYRFSSIKRLNMTYGRAQLGPPGYELDLLYIGCLAALGIRRFRANGDRQLSREEVEAACIERRRYGIRSMACVGSIRIFSYELNPAALQNEAERNGSWKRKHQHG